MLAMMISPFGLNKVAPVRPCCDPSGGGWAGRTAQRSQQRGEPGSEKNLSREECAQRRGNCFRWKVAAMKPKAQPRHRQDSQQDKDAQAARSRMETWPTRHPRVTASPACALTRARSMPRRQGQSAPAAARGTCLRRGVEAPSGEVWRCVGEPSFMTYRQRIASVEDGTLLHNLSQQARA